MKTGFTQSLHVCLAAAFLVAAGLVSPAYAQHKSVDVSVSIVGNVEGIDEAEVEDLVEHLLEAGHVAVSDEDGPDIIELHIGIAIDDDGEGFAIHLEAGAWKGGGDIDDIDQLDELLQTEVTEFEETIDEDE